MKMTPEQEAAEEAEVRAQLSSIAAALPHMREARRHLEKALPAIENATVFDPSTQELHDALLNALGIMHHYSSTGGALITAARMCGDLDGPIDLEDARSLLQQDEYPS